MRMSRISILFLAIVFLSSLSTCEWSCVCGCGSGDSGWGGSQRLYS